MAVQLIPEDGTGVLTANTYATLQQAQAYFNTRLYAEAWTNAGADNQARALIMATRLIDASYQFGGRQSYPGQVLAWPRLYCPNPEQVAGYWPANKLPPLLVNATCELAGELLKKNRLAEPAYAGIRSMNLGQGAIQFTFDPGDRPPVLPQSVAQIMQAIGASSRAVGGGFIKRLGRA